MYTYTHRIGELHIDCEFEYEAAESGGRNSYGQIDDQPFPESITLCSAKINGEDVTDVLSEVFIEDLEDAALADMKQSAIDSFDEPDDDTDDYDGL